MIYPTSGRLPAADELKNAKMVKQMIRRKEKPEPPGVITQRLATETSQHRKWWQNPQRKKNLWKRKLLLISRFKAALINKITKRRIQPAGNRWPVQFHLNSSTAAHAPPDVKHRKHAGMVNDGRPAVVPAIPSAASGTTAYSATRLLVEVLLVKAHACPIDELPDCTDDDGAHV